MDSSRLILNDQSYSLADIQLGNYKAHTQSEISALQFCNNWLNGKEVFFLKTSGSTGIPKEIPVTREQLKASAQMTIAALNLESGFTSLVCLDTRYVAGTMMLVRSMEAGMSMIVVEPSSDPLERFSPDTKIDFAAMVPLQVDAILNSIQPERLNKITSLLIGGAPLSAGSINRLQQTTCACYATYGMTETVSHIALQRINGPARQNYFQVLPGININTDERGCLVVDASHITSNAIITNDLVEIISTNQFRWLGRIDNVINTGGVKVFAEKIDEVVAKVFEELTIFNRFFIAALPDERLGQAVTLIIEGVLSEQVQQKLTEKLAAKLSRFEQPRSIRYVENFVLTNTGKLDKLKTLELLEKQ